MTPSAEHHWAGRNPAIDPAELAVQAAIKSESSAGRLSGYLATAARWIYLAILVYAPWAYGSTRPSTILGLNILAASCLTFWLLSHASARRWPRVPLLVLGPVLLLSAQAGWMTWHAHSDYYRELAEFFPRQVWLPSAPGSIDYQRSLATAPTVALVLGMLLVAVDFARDSSWRRRLVWTMALAGFSLILFGLIQRFAGAPAIFWQQDNTGHTFFASYRYHSNAGAFINLIWPLLAALLLNAIRRQHPYRIALAAALLLALVGLVVTGSRAATVIGLVFVGLWLLGTIVHARRGHLPELHLPTVMVAGTLLCLLLLVAAAMVGLDVSARRWTQGEQILDPNNPRFLVYSVCVQMIPHAGWFGFGPGTFQTVFPYFSHSIGDRASGVWLDAHQDYLQALIEWGYVGTAAFAILVVIGFWRGLRFRPVSRTEQTLNLGACSGVAMILVHSLVDFPLQIASLQIYFVTLLALLWTSKRATTRA